MDEKDEELLEQFCRVGAKPKNVANILSEAKHANYTTKVANNLLKKVRGKVKFPAKCVHCLWV